MNITSSTTNVVSFTTELLSERPRTRSEFDDAIKQSFGLRDGPADSEARRELDAASQYCLFMQRGHHYMVPAQAALIDLLDEQGPLAREMIGLHLKNRALAELIDTLAEMGPTTRETITPHQRDISGATYSPEPQIAALLQVDEIREVVLTPQTLADKTPFTNTASDAEPLLTVLGVACSFCDEGISLGWRQDSDIANSCSSRTCSLHQPPGAGQSRFAWWLEQRGVYTLVPSMRRRNGRVSYHFGPLRFYLMRRGFGVHVAWFDHYWRLRP